VNRTFVGFGLGPIQAGLFLFEAFRSGNFSRLVVSETDRELIQAVRRNQGAYIVNIAHDDGIETAEVTGVEIYDPGSADGRRAIVAAVAESEELATAVPSVGVYQRGGETSIARLLGEGADGQRRRVIYTAENHNFAARILQQAVLRERADFPLGVTRFLNTVIGKMSRSVLDADEISRLGLSPFVPALNRAVLVEAFNRILISRVDLPGFRRAIEVFEERDSLLPFEEAKLYGHNAVHAVIGYLGYVAGCATISEAARDAGIEHAARAAFLKESGAALCRRHAHVGDPLFTMNGFQAYAEDLLNRMANPYLNDTVARVCRHPARKLGYSDRIFGTMRLALEYDIEPANMALAAAGALLYLKQDGRPVPKDELPSRIIPPAEVEDILRQLWGAEGKEDDRAGHLISLTSRALGELAEFHAGSDAPGR